MRNLKKLFAVIMVVAMLASIMVPAFAADYEADALKLKALGLFKGYSDTDLGLDDSLTREQGLTFMLRARGLEDEVQAMSTEEIAAQLAKVTDLDTVSEWAKPYVAYAVKNGLTKGIDASILPNIKFAGQLLLTGKEFINFMLNAMGYEEEWDNVLSKAADIGMLSAGQAVTFGSILELKRDIAAGIISFAMSGTTASGVSLAQALVDAGAVDAAAMAEAGYYTPTATPTQAPVVVTATASTDNLIQIYVDFSVDVDETTAETKGNYTLSSGKVADATLNDDGIVVLTLEAAKAQQSKVNLTIKSVKDAAGTVIPDITIKDIEFFDVTPPEVVDVAVVGKDTFKVTFSEPMAESNKTFFEVNGGKLYVKEVKRQVNNTEMLVTLYSSFKEGDVTLKVKRDNEDFAGFGVREEVFTVTVVKDTEAPVVVGYEKATPTEVVLIWSEDIVAKTAEADLANYYHTNSKNPASKVTVDGNKMTLTFDKDYALPEGTAYVYVLKDAVKDLWDNKNVQQMISVDVELDETAPEVKSVEQGSAENLVVVTYTEAMDSTSTKKVANYTILNSAGEEQKDLVKTVTLSEDLKTATLTLSKKVGGDYSLVIEGVKDAAGNEIVSVTVPFTVVDKTVPVPADFTATLYNAGAADQMIKVTFGESMAIEGKYAINDVEKYQYEDAEGNFKPLKGLKSVTIEVVDNGKAIEIKVPHQVDGKANWTFAAGDILRIARVADAAGNYTAELSFDKTLVVTESVAISSVEATACDTIVITFADEVAFEIEDFTVTDGVYDFQYAEISTTVNSKGKTVATLKLTEKLPYTWDEGDYVLVVEPPEDEDELGTENVYGVKVSDEDKNIADKIKPELIKVDSKLAKFENGTTDSTITLTFSEDLAADASNLYAHDLIVRKANGDALTPITNYTIAVDDNVITITVLAVSDITDYSIESAATIRYIKGLDGNLIKAFEAIVNE